MKALNSLYEAQKIAFSPFVFQTVYTMSSLGIMDELYEERDGLTIEEIAKRKNVSEYGVRVLVEMAKAADILELNDDKYTLSKIGYFLTRDEMTKVNMMFTQDICYKGLFHLKDSILNGKPEGLKEIGPWKTIYEGLSLLPEPLKTSWFEKECMFNRLFLILLITSRSVTSRMRTITIPSNLKSVSGMESQMSFLLLRSARRVQLQKSSGSSGSGRSGTTSMNPVSSSSSMNLSRPELGHW